MTGAVSVAGLLLAFSAGIAAQDIASTRAQLAQAQAAFKDKRYEDAIRLASEPYINCGADWDQTDGICAEAVLLTANAYAATGDYRTAELTFRVMKSKAKIPTDIAVATEGKLLMSLAAARKP